MTVIITGANGMLGRATSNACEALDLPIKRLAHHSFDVCDPSSFTYAKQGDTVINCAGVIPPGDDVEMIRVNSLAPHYMALLAKRIGFRLIHVSTDCVFSGWTKSAPVMHTRSETPNPDTHYGRTKYAGEPMVWPNVMVVRTSFVGPNHGLWHWLEHQPQDAIVEGYTQAWWSGSTVWAVAERLALMAKAKIDNSFGVFHLATERPINKYQVLGQMLELMDRPDLRLVAVPKRLDRSLLPTIELPSFEAALDRAVSVGYQS